NRIRFNPGIARTLDRPGDAERTQEPAYEGRLARSQVTGQMQHAPRRDARRERSTYAHRGIGVGQFKIDRHGLRSARDARPRLGPRAWLPGRGHRRRGSQRRRAAAARVARAGPAWGDGVYGAAWRAPRAARG